MNSEFKVTHDPVLAKGRGFGAYVDLHGIDSTASIKRSMNKIALISAIHYLGGDGIEYEKEAKQLLAAFLNTLKKSPVTLRSFLEDPIGTVKYNQKVRNFLTYEVTVTPDVFIYLPDDVCPFSGKKRFLCEHCGYGELNNSLNAVGRKLYDLYGDEGLKKYMEVKGFHEVNIYDHLLTVRKTETGNLPMSELPIRFIHTQQGSINRKASNVGTIKRTQVTAKNIRRIDIDEIDEESGLRPNIGRRVSAEEVERELRSIYNDL